MYVLLNSKIRKTVSFVIRDMRADEIEWAITQEGRYIILFTTQEICGKAKMNMLICIQFCSENTSACNSSEVGFWRKPQYAYLQWDTCSLVTIPMCVPPQKKREIYGSISNHILVTWQKPCNRKSLRASVMVIGLKMFPSSNRACINGWMEWSLKDNLQDITVKHLLWKLLKKY